MANDLFLQGKTYQVEKLRFYAFQHPYVCTFVEELIRSRLDGLLALENQRLDGDMPYAILALLGKGTYGSLFGSTYEPNMDVVSDGPPLYNVDFSNDGAYSQYNWELFFHIPLYIATRLMQDQRHEEAMRWFHYVFNPMTDDPSTVPQRYWNFKPFRDQGGPERIQALLSSLQDPKADKKDAEAAIADWREHPFQPHRIARGRPGAYMKTVVMKYIDNLIAWADKLFRRDTIESINEATQLYILAANQLGARPYRVPTPAEVKPEELTYKALRPKLDDFSNAVVKTENLIILSPFAFGAAGSSGSNGSEAVHGLANLAFCIPHNDKLLGYWDTVEDRLFKIRHCMNIEGVVRQLPLFEPPIDPALLVRATAMGLDLSQVLDDLSAPLPHYRFSFMLQKAHEFCEALKQLGGLLLSALEKRDAEELSRIRAGHEKHLLKAVLEVKKKQVKEAEETLASLEKAKELADTRAAHYVAVSARLPEETQFLTKQTEAVAWQLASQMAALEGSTAGAAPEITIAAAGTASGTYTSAIDGKRFALLANLISGYLGMLGSIASHEGSAADYKGRLVRAQQERDLQIKLANQERAQIDKQIAAAELRYQIAENELSNHERQIEQADEVESFLREKFTNQDLYNWMKTQVSAVYFQAYKLAYDLARKAERAYRYELEIQDSSFVQFGAWDSLHKGLLAGEKLSLDLRRLESSYIEQNKRTYELTKHVSLFQLDPYKLIELRETGSCEVAVPEALFDLDYPGHYRRRIKSVSITLPSVTGPYTSVSCTLTLLKHGIRRNTAKPKAEGDKSFVEDLISLQSIATSGGRNDAGMFELNFRDERKLPFEGAGVVSTWRIELPAPAFQQFDYDTISDVILHLNYTALNGGAAFKSYREGQLKEKLNELFSEVMQKNGLARMFDLRHEFPNEWHRLQNKQPVELKLGYDRLPYFINVLGIQDATARWFAKSAAAPASNGWTHDQATGLWYTGDESVAIDKALDVPPVDTKSVEALWLLVVYTVKDKL